MKKSKVLYLTATASGYGGENSLYDLVTRLPDRFKPIVLVPEPGPLLDNLRKAGVTVDVVPYAVLHRHYFHPMRIVRYLVFAIVSVVRLIKIFRKIKPRIVHTNNVLVLPGAFAAKLLGIPHCWHVREIIQTYHIHDTLWRIWRWIILTMSSKVICVSRAVQSQFGLSNKTTVIHDGVDILLFSPAGTGKTTKSRVHREPAVGIVGRVDHRRKGQDLFIEAADIVLKKYHRVRFVVVGDERPELKEPEKRLHDLVRMYGIEKNILFTGHVPRERIVDVLNDLDIVVLCSKKPEGLGIVLLEAMACGKSVIAPREGGPLDILEGDKCGVLIEPRSPERLAEAILSLLRDRKSRARIGIAARQRVEKMFAIEDHVSKMVKLYEESLSSNS